MEQTLSKKCKAVIDSAIKDLGADIFGPGGYSPLDLLADNFENESLETLKSILVELGYTKYL